MITLTLGQVKALLRIAPAKEARHYLCGVYVDPEGYAVVTDGHCLLAIRCEPSNAEGYIVGRDVLELAAKNAHKGAGIELSLNYVRYLTKAGSQSLPHNRIDGRFPDWRRVVPQSCSGDRAWFDSEKLEQLRKCLDDMRSGKGRSIVFLQQNGNSPAIVETSPEVVALIMPMRDDGKFDAGKHVGQFLTPRAVVQEVASA